MRRSTPRGCCCRTCHSTLRSGSTGNYGVGPGADRMFTFSATGHWGHRLESGAELYLNVEMAAGDPFARNLVGLGSFTNGEITRAAGTNPMVYRQRLFLRQTWNHGGGQEQLASEQNQLAGTVDRNRFVLTAGNFATLDVFDDNSPTTKPTSACVAGPVPRFGRGMGPEQGGRRGQQGAAQGGGGQAGVHVVRRVGFTSPA